MNKANKAAFSKSSLKGLTDTVDRTDQSPSVPQFSGGWWMASLHGEVGSRSDLARDRFTASKGS